MKSLLIGDYIEDSDNFFYSSISIKGKCISIEWLSDFPNLETVILGNGAFCNANTAVFQSIVDVFILKRSS